MLQFRTTFLAMLRLRRIPQSSPTTNTNCTKFEDTRINNGTRCSIRTRQFSIAISKSDFVQTRSVFPLQKSQLVQILATFLNANDHFSLKLAIF